MTRVICRQNRDDAAAMTLGIAWHHCRGGALDVPNSVPAAGLGLHELVALGVGGGEELFGGDLAGPGKLRLGLDLGRQVRRVEVVEPEDSAGLRGPLLLNVSQWIVVELGSVD